MTNSFSEDIKSPCIKSCCLNEKDICLGCYRSLDEILAWHQAKHEEKEFILKNCQYRKQKP